MPLKSKKTAFSYGFPTLFLYFHHFAIVFLGSFLNYQSWLVVPTPLKNMKVSWDDDIPNIWENKSHVPVTTNQIIVQHIQTKLE